MFFGSNIDNNKITFIIENKRVKSRSKVKLLGITIDDKLSFILILKTYAAQQVTVCQL